MPASGQLELLRQREPIEALIVDESRDAALRQRLGEVLQARRFASQGCAAGQRQLSALRRTRSAYVVWNLFATEEFSVKPLEHCFPIAGCVAYRGYFRQGAARGEARLRLSGLIPMWRCRGLFHAGWFADPLLSSMLRRNDEQLAALIFHELAHQQLYLPGDTAFNESYATFVEREGLRAVRAHRDLPQRDEQARVRYRQLVELLLDTRQRLDQLYASGRSTTELRALKQAEFATLRQRYRHLRQPVERRCALRSLVRPATEQRHAVAVRPATAGYRPLLLCSSGASGTGALSPGGRGANGTACRRAGSQAFKLAD